MPIRIEVLPFLGVAAGFGVIVWLLARTLRVRRARAVGTGIVLAAVLAGYFLYFFRDPPRYPPQDPAAVISAADGVVARIVTLDEAQFRKAAAFSGMNETNMAPFLGRATVRISIFLSLFDVHVNRTPISGASRFLGYFPGRHYFTFQEKSSDYNQHNAILIESDRTCCLLNQIVGPVARRVVYWPDHDKAVELKAGDKIGMMKFGSRLDMYFPAADLEILVKEGSTVRAGETVIAMLRRENES